MKFWNQAYEVLDTRKNRRSSAPIGIAVPIPNSLELWLNDGSAIRLDVDDNNFEEGHPIDSMTIYTDDGMVTLLPLRLTSFEENVAPFLDLEGTSFTSDAELNAHFARLCQTEV